MALAGITAAESISYTEMDSSLQSGAVFTNWSENNASEKPWHNLVNTGADFTLSFDISDINGVSAGQTLLSAAGSNSISNWDDGFLQLWLNESGELTFNNTCGGNDSTKYFDGSTRGNPTVSAYTMNLGVSAIDTTSTAYTITLVSNSSDKTFTAYVNGQQVSQWINWDTNTGITGMQLGKRFGNGRDISGTATFENVIVWNRALSASEISGFVIPEPNTATLSLLALAGLAARRRRK